MKTDKELGEIGAKAAYEETSVCAWWIAIAPQSSCYSEDVVKRTAFAKAVREAIFADCGEVPSADELRMLKNRVYWDGRNGQIKDMEAAMEAVRQATRSVQTKPHARSSRHRQTAHNCFNPHPTKSMKTTTEHLNLILAHLDKLLATAEKRTPGEWVVGWNMIGDGISKSICNAPMKNEQTTTLEWVSDKQFIASCAGNAEAGWRATRATVRSVLEMIEWAKNDDNRLPELNDGVLKQAVEIAAPILSAFPLELITTNNP